MTLTDFFTRQSNKLFPYWKELSEISRSFPYMPRVFDTVSPVALSIEYIMWRFFLHSRIRMSQ